jgi:two-component system sensor histidine kinase ChvG
MIGAALAFGDRRLLVTSNARDITRTVRAERLRFGLALAVVSILSILLSLFLARTIARPLRRLANAATRVRLGRARDVVVPRLPDRSDEIGTLARALSDMTGALRARIDAGEHLAADIAHELKNPLASLRSALEGLDRVEQPDLRRQLMDIANDDVRRLDRLVTDISEASRVDAELSRTRFKLVDIGQLLESIVDARRARARAGDPDIAFARPRVGAAVVMGEPLRLVRVIENLLDNALSFSPAGGLVRIGATCADDEIIIRVEDEGPGVPPDQRETIFRRFHSVRPQGEDFGKHSGLGLAIARAIVDAHQGRITAVDREGQAQGACFEIRLPAVTTTIE